MFGRYRELVFYRANAELKREASRAYLGVLWWFIEPVLYMSVFYLVFGVGLRRGGADFVVYLLSGLIIWKWFDSTIKSAANSIATTVGLMHQVYFPKLILPAVVVVVNIYKFLMVLIIFLVFLIFFWEIPVTPYWWCLLLLMAIQLLLICSLAGLAAALVPIIPDIKYLVEYALALGFFLSGIFFDIHDMPLEIQSILRYNPMLVLIESYRDVLLYARWPNFASLLNIFLVSVVMFVSMLFVLIKLDRFYPRVVG